MAKKIKTQSACRDCKKCMQSSVAHAGRNAGRGLLAASTVGMSEIGFAARKKCRVCDHQMSLHHGAAASTVQPGVQFVQDMRVPQVGTQPQPTNWREMKAAWKAAVSGTDALPETVAPMDVQTSSPEAIGGPSQPQGPPPGWYSIAGGPEGQLRWWDGVQWTEHAKQGA